MYHSPTKPEKNCIKLNKISLFIIAFPSISSACFDFGHREYIILHDPNVSEVRIFTCGTSTFSQTNPLTSNHKFIVSNLIPCDAEILTGLEKLGEEWNQTAVLVCFSAWIETTQLATFTSSVIFLLCQLLTPGSLNKNFSPLFLNQAHN